MNKIIYFNCYSGISGDMIIGAFLDAGFEIKYLKNELKKLKLNGYKIKAKKVKRGSIYGTKFDVYYDKALQKHRTLNDINKIIEKSNLKNEIKENSKNIFLKIAKTEAKAHNTRLNDVHFHEIGAIDSIIDIVGSCIIFDFFKDYQILASPINIGSGMVKTSHGFLPIPAPATTDLLKGIPVYSNIPTHIKNAELTTPTGAAIISYFCSGFKEIPIMKIQKIGYGAGTKELQGLSNLLQIFIGNVHTKYEEDTVSVIETNIDDLSPLIYDNLIKKLLKEGALDAFITNILMKKSRPAILLTVITEKTNVEKLTNIIFNETSTFGIRTYDVKRQKLKREIKTLNTKFGKIRFKIGYIGNKEIKKQPEYEDCLKLSEKTGIPLVKMLNQC